MDGAVLITGATSGLGRRTALALAARGRDVIVGGRRSDAVAEVCREVERRTSVNAFQFVADLASLEDVRRALTSLHGRPLHGIVTNAGVSTMRDVRTVDGFELTFAVNVLAHQLILQTLAPQLRDRGRVVVVSSGVHDPDNRLARRAGIPVPRWTGTRAIAKPDEAADDARLDDGRERYSTSKLANILQARGLQAWLRDAGRDVDVFAIDPGLMVDTRLGRELPAPMRAVFRGIGTLATPFVDNMRMSDTSAGHIASLLEDDVWQGRGFSYLDGDQVRPPSPDAQRDDLVEELWDESAALLNSQP